MKCRDKSQQGFSLIELAVVMIISGFLLVTALSTYKQYIEKKRIYTTQAKIETVTKAMNQFFSVYGHYPCPASFSAAPGDSNFGQATDCYNSSAVASGACGDENSDGNDDYCVASVTKDHDSNPITPDKTFRIRKGTIPFQALKEGIGWEVDETAFTGPTPYGIRTGSQVKKYQRTYDIGAKDTVDLYDNRLTYTLTETQGTETYLPQLGAITIEDEHGRIVSSNADYVLVSHGRDASGAYGFFGDLRGAGCVASLPDNERENCDGDAVYVSSLRYDAQGSQKYDDMLVYRTWKNYYLWDVSDADATNVHNLNTGNVGVGIKNPIEKMHVFEGNLLAEEEAERTSGGVVTKPAGSILATEYCNYDNDSGEDCFIPDKIAGEGMDCSKDADNFSGVALTGPVVMRGIQEQKVKCERLYTANQTVGCPAGSFIQGFVYNLSTKSISIPSDLCKSNN